MNIKQFSWVFPFILFLTGYLAARLTFHVNEVSVPSVIGKTLTDGISELSAFGINARLLREKEDPDMQEGIILDQVPRGNARIRPNYPVHLTVSKKPAPKKAPNFIGKKESEIKQISGKKLIKVKVFYIHNSYPKGSCFAQYPTANDKIKDAVIVYISSGNQSFSVIPQLINSDASSTQDYLLQHGIRVDLFHKNDVHENHFCKKCKVLEQNPIAGSIVKLDKDLQIQILVG